MCTTLRLDDVNDNLENQGIAPPLYPGSGTKIFVVYSERGDPAGNSNHNRRVKCNYFDWNALAVGVPVVVEAYTPTIDSGDSLGGCVLNNGTMLVGYGAANPRIKESTDGVTWANSAEPTGAFGSGAGGVPKMVGMFTDGVTAWLLVQLSAGGGGYFDLNIYKRTGAGTWIFVKKIYDAAAAPTPPFFDFSLTGLSGSRPGAMKDANTGLIVGDYQAAGEAPQTANVRCLYTTDGWNTVAEANIIDQFPHGFGRTPVVVPAPGGRVYVLWIDNATGVELPIIAYTDDWGAHWTVIGSPTIFADTPWDNEFDRAFYISQATGALFASAFNTSDGTNERHFLFTGPGALTGWTERICQHLTVVRGPGSCGAAIIAGGGWFRLFNKSNTGPPDYFSIDLLWEPGVETLPPPPPCITLPTASYILDTGGTATICGPVSHPEFGQVYTYAWTGPGGFAATSRCITVSVAGTYNLTVTDSFSQQTFCLAVVISVPPLPAPSLTKRSPPFYRGVLTAEESDHPSGVPTTRRVGW